MQKQKILDLISVAIDGDGNAIAELRSYLTIAGGVDLLKMGIRMLDYGALTANMDLSEGNPEPFIVETEIMGITISIAL